jgi:hypothetical protein
LETGITLASCEGVPQPPERAVHHEPIVLWRMERGNGLVCHAVIDPRSNGAVVTWFINGLQLGCRDFDDWTSALGWSERLRFQNWTVGWRLSSE